MKILESYLREIFQKFTIYCDMDGVLVDFDRGVRKIFPEHQAFGNSKKQDVKMWKEISKIGAEYWAYLPWMNDGKELWNYIINFQPHILTATPSSEYDRKQCVKGKRIWIGRELGSAILDRTHTVLRSEKQNFSNFKSILIDDKPKNIKEFQKKGIGILHTSAKETIKTLIELGVT